MTIAIVVGSVADVAAKAGMSIAEAFISVEAVAIVDVSGSMSSSDSRGGQRRYDVACQELAKLQAAMPGKISVIGFDDRPRWFPGGRPEFTGGGTDVASALAFARQSDVPGIRFILISDGQPDNATDAMAEARKFKARIDTVFVGPENDGLAQKFLRELADASGGLHVKSDKAQDLAQKAQTLLLA